MGPEAAIDHGDEAPAPYQLTDLVRQTIEETFATLKWSRVVSLQEQHPDLRSNWLMAPDIIEQREAQMEIERPAELEEPIFFDPKAFQDAHDELKIEDYMMKEGALEEWALRTIRIRAAAVDKASENMEEDAGQVDAAADQDVA